MTKNKFYAVKKGLTPGIYHTWADCQKQTNGVSGAVFKSFSTHQAADQFLGGEVEVVVPHNKKLDTESRISPNNDAVQSTEPSAATEASDNCADQPGAAVGLHGLVVVRNRSDTSVVPPWMNRDTTYRLEFDGASRGNPGPAGAGAALFEDAGDRQVGSICLNLGRMTNNQAEYYGLLAGLEAAGTVGIKHLKVLGDSQLVVRQVKGQYKVSNEALQVLHARVKHVLTSFEDFQIGHVLRDKNKIADELSNRAIDTIGWDGLKDMQGQLWGVCDVQRASHKGPEVAMETDANVAVRSKKRASTREPASVMAGNSFKHVKALPRNAWKYSWSPSYHTCLLNSCMSRKMPLISLTQSAIPRALQRIKLYTSPIPVLHKPDFQLEPTAQHYRHSSVIRQFLQHKSACAFASAVRKCCRF